MRIRVHMVRRALMLLVASVTVVAGGCGDSDDEPAESRRAADVPTRPDAAPDPSNTKRSGEEQRVASVVSDMYHDLVTGNASGVCAVMSTPVREEIAQNVPGGSTEAIGRRTCQTSFEKFLDVAARTGILEQALKAEVGDVEVRGQRATATVSVSGRAGNVQLVKENGQWRFGEQPLGAGR